MKPKILRVIRYDYFSSLLSVISIVALLLLVAIIIVDKSVLVTGITIFLVSTLLLVAKVYYTRSEVFRLRDSKVVGQVHRFDQTNGSFYVVVNYEVKTRTLGRRFPILAGPVLRANLRKLKEVTLLVDMEKPKKVYIESFFY